MENRPDNLKTEYIYRINQVIDYINDNLDRDLSLKVLSRVANFSEYHFHRIFRSIIHEPLSKYVQRLRIEKAAFQLICYPQKTITEIAHDNGFSGSQFFSKVFNQYFNTTASEWRKSKIVEVHNGPYAYNPGNNRKGQSDIQNTSVEVKELPGMNAVYIREIGPYKGDAGLYADLFGSLFRWAEMHEQLNAGTKALALYDDFMGITDDNKLRLTACITVDEEVRTEGRLGRLKIQGGKYAVARVEITKDEYEEAWNWMYGEWLPCSGYQPDNKPAFELFHNDPKEHPRGLHVVDLCIPVKPFFGKG